MSVRKSYNLIAGVVNIPLNVVVACLGRAVVFKHILPGNCLLVLYIASYLL